VKTGGQRGYQQLIVHLANTGNVLRKPTGEVEVLEVVNNSRHLLETLPFVMDTFLPQTSIDYPILLKRALRPGTYEARVALTYPNAAGTSEMNSATSPFTVSKTDVKQVFTSAAPTQQPAGPAVASSTSSTQWVWIAIAALGALAVLALLAWWLLRRRGRKHPEYMPTVVMPLPPLPPVRTPQAASPTEPHEATAPVPYLPAAATEFSPAAYAATQSEPVSTDPSADACDGDHLWEVAYDRGELGRDGVWRFPHKCRECGLELMAIDTADAATQAHAPAARH
jgi:hypothetical protein